MEYNEKFDKKLMDNHDYDGIKELDNDPPAWLMWIFWITIFFGAIYLGHYILFKEGDSQAAEYENEVADAKKAGLSKDTLKFDETKIVLLNDSVNLEAGKKLFAEKICITCHGIMGEGNAVGPNLADEYWINGGSPENVFKVIKYGVPAKGMTPFKDQLSNEKILQLVSYVMVKIKGSNPPNAKAPQGTKM